jgi:hypothetical protein
MLAENVCVPDRRPDSPPQPKMFEFVRTSDGARFYFELRDRGGYGTQVLVFRNGEALFGQLHQTVALAVEWALEQRKALERPIPRGCERSGKSDDQRTSAPAP